MPARPARAPEASVGSTAVDLIFLDANGTETDRAPRARLPVAPAPIPVGVTTADAEGGYRLVIAHLAPGRYRLTADYAGDATHWLARATVSIDLR